MKINLLTSIPGQGEEIGDWQDPLSFLYGFLIAIGALLALAFIIYKFVRKKLPLKEIRLVGYIAVPLSLLGASFFGKLYMPFTPKVWEYFFFWRPGMSMFGGLLFGLAAGYIILYLRGRTLQISIYAYADCIIPAILIAQIIGRWGNLFNHEILGREIEDISKINWLPDFIWKRLFYIRDINGNQEIAEKVVYREPLFLYESFANLLLFILILCTPSIFKLFSKKPWKVDPIKFPIKKCPITKDEMLNDKTRLQFDIVYKSENDKHYLTKRSAWNKAYYYLDLSEDLKNKLAKEQEREDNLFKQEKSLFKKIKKYSKKDCKKLNDLYNHDKYLICRSGVQTSLYFIGYGIIRFILEFRRDLSQMTIKTSFAANLVLITLLIIFGMILLVNAQFIAPVKWRKINWFYEKQY